MSDDRIPIIGRHRGVGIHDFQPRDRITKVVKPAIDAVFTITDPVELVEYAADPSYPPEARLFAAARAEAAWQLSAENRSLRPLINLDYLRAATAGLDSLHWIDRNRYASMLDHTRPGALARPVPLTDGQMGR